MAESYRGLTIRIGGDTSKLTQSLRAANGAISQTQSELRKLSTALKLDPTNLEAYNLQMGFMSNQATNTAMKLAQLKDAAEQLRTQTKTLSGKSLIGDDGQIHTVEELARTAEELGGNIENAALKAAQARAEFNQTVASLGQMHNEVTKLASDAAKVESERIAKALDPSEAIPSIEKVRDAFASLPEYVTYSQEAVDKLVAGINSSLSKSLDDMPADLKKQMEQAIATSEEAYGRLRDTVQGEYAKAVSGATSDVDKDRITAEYTEAFSNISAAAAKSTQAITSHFQAMWANADGDITKLIEKATELGSVKFNFDSRNTSTEQLEESLENIRTVLESMPEGTFDKAKIEGFIGEIERIQKLLVSAQTQTEQWNLVTRFQDLIVEIQKGESSLERFSRVLSDMKTPSQLTMGLTELTSNAQVLKDAYSALSSMGTSFEKAFEADPSNTQYLEQAMKAFSAAEQVAIENAEVLQKKLDSFDASEIYKNSDLTKSSAQELFDASEAADVAKSKLATLEGNIAHTETVLKKLNATADETKSIITSDEKAKLLSEERVGSIEELSQRLEYYKSQLESTKAAEKDASDNLEWAKKRSEIESATAEAVKWRTAIEAAYDAELRLVDTQHTVDLLGDSPEKLEEYEDQLNAIVARAEALNKASKIDTKNIELATAKSQALADADRAAKDAIAEINNQLAKIDTSNIDEVRATYGTVENAVKKTADAAKDAKKKADDAKKSFADLLKGTQYEGMADAILEADSAIHLHLTPSVEEHRDKVRKLIKDWEDVRDAHLNAVDLSNYENLTAEKAAISTKVSSIGAESVNEAAFQQALDRFAQAAEQAGRKIVESANEIDSAYRDMRKTVNGTEEQFESLRQKAVEFSQTHITSADQILEIESLGGQLGLSVESLDAFGHAISNVGIATDISVEDASLKFGQLTNIMSDLDETTFDKIADALVRLGNNTATTESAIMDVAQRMSSVANVTNMTTPELLAWSAAIASTGQHAESAATAITRTLTDIGEAVSQGGDALEGFAKISGMTAEEFEAAWRNNSSKALEAFVKGLSTFTDDSAETIEALNAVGITSVRQETALLSLTQAIGNLDDAVEMSTNAFNGVSDQWGQAGDAAYEAQQKSEGFSGSLGILQNNLTNLAASLGEGLIPFMDAASGVLQALTDALNALPAPVKSIVVGFGGLAAVMAVVTSTVGALKSGWAGLFGDGTSLANLLANLASKFGMVTAAAEGTEVATAAASATIGGPYVAAIAAVVAVIGLVAAAVADWKQQQEELKEATTGLETAISDADKAVQSYKADIGGTTPSIQEMRDATRELTKEQAEFAKQLEQDVYDQNIEHAGLDAYVERIEELSQKGNLTAREMNLLNDAIKHVNETTGSSISLVSEQGSTLAESADQIREIAEAYEQQDRVDLMSKKYEDAQQHVIELENQLEELGEYGEEAISKNNAEMDRYLSTLANAPHSVSSLATEHEKLQAKLDSARANMAELEEEIAKGEYSFSSLENALSAAGVSSEQWASLTEQQAEQVKKAFDGKLSSIVSMLQSFGLTVNKYAQQYLDQINAIASADPSVPDSGHTTEDVNKYKKQQTKDYNDEKKIRDNAAKQYQRDLEKQYKRAQKESQKYLKSYKKALDDEVDAHKEATDQKLKDIEREYKAKEKLLDQEYERKNKEYEDQIAAIEAAQEADDKAREQDERDDKLTELQKELARAQRNGSSKTIKEAKDALKQYYKDIAYEDRKATRDAQKQKIKDAQDAAKDELSDKKAKLKESYDLTVESYKAEREAELKLLQEANDAAYEMVSEAESAKLEYIKETNQQALDDYKAANDQYLSDLKDRQEEELEYYKTHGDAVAQQVEETAEKVTEVAKAAASEIELGTQGMTSKMTGGVTKGLDLMSKIMVASTSPLGASAQKVVAAATDPMAIMSNITGAYAEAATNAIVNGFSSETKLQALQYAAAALVNAGADELAVMELLSGQYGSQSAWALANGYSDADAAKKVQDTAKAIVSANGDQLKVMAILSEQYGTDAMIRLANAVAGNADKPVGAIARIGDGVVSTLNGAAKGAGVAGENISIALNNGMVSGADRIFSNAAAISNGILNSMRRALDEHSPSRKAMQIMDYFMQGLMIGMEQGEDGLESETKRLSRLISAGMALDPSDLSSGLTQSLIDDMRTRESELTVQAERMAKAFERGFDPSLDLKDKLSSLQEQVDKAQTLRQRRAAQKELLDYYSELAAAQQKAMRAEQVQRLKNQKYAAYDALDRIDAGELRRQQRIAASKNVDNSTYAPVMNFTINATVREEADIDRISQQIALRVQRQLNAKIG